MKRIGVWWFVAGALLAWGSVLLGNSLQAELRTLPLAQLMQEPGLEALRVLGFAFGLPLGLGLSVLGALLGSESSPRRLLAWMGVILVLVPAALLAPGLWGRESSAGFFGIGGSGILLLVLGLIWLWGRYRARVLPQVRTGVDLQGMGYLCFALAAWNLCGAAAMPGFALEPERMMAMGSQTFAVGQMKTVMSLFLLGWLVSLLGYWVMLGTQRD